MEAGDSFDLPRYNVNAGGPSAYPMYSSESSGAARGHQRLPSLLAGEQSPVPAGQESSVQRSNSLSSAFYPPALAGYRQDSAQQLHPYQSSDLYGPQDYGNSYGPRRVNTQTTGKGVTLSPRSSLRHQPPTSPAISVTMEPAMPSSPYPQQHPPGLGYGNNAGGAADAYGQNATVHVDATASYHNPSDRESPSPSLNNYPPTYNAAQSSVYHQSQQQLPPQPQQSQDPYSNLPHYAHQQPPQDITRSTSSLQHSSSLRTSISTPNTPMTQRTYQSSLQSTQQASNYNSRPPLEQPPPENRRAVGLRRVGDPKELRPMFNPQPVGRRPDPNGTGYLSPTKSLTTHISHTYNLCNPQFHYEVAHNPRRVLTKPSKPVHNDGYDNEDFDYILYVNDYLGTTEGHNKYLILDILGQGTFGQVVKCQNIKTHEIVAVKVVKNKPAYFNQSMMEVQILKMLNDDCDPHDEHHILRLRETFIHKNHLCLVFELLSSNLYELIKQNQFGGLSTQLVKVFTAQLLDALTILKDASLIHCDLKPENILLKSLQAPTIKVIDFGSACHEQQTVYTYIQSRFYRSPEVLLGLHYTSAIDMWSLGCIAVELFLGLPLFPGTSEYNQITRIVEMLGMPPTWMLEKGKQSLNFFGAYEEYGQKHWRLKSLEQYSREHNTNEQPGKKYFQFNTLPEIIKNAPVQKSSSKSQSDIDKEMQHRASFIDFVSGLLNLNPLERWTPQQARMHPFITGEKFTKPFSPMGQIIPPPNGRSPGIALTPETSASLVQQQTPVSDPGSGKQRYGGLIPQPPKGNRAYQDAGSYNQRLAQHQVHMAQQQAAQSNPTTGFKNPYLAQNTGGSGSSSNGQNAYSYQGSPQGTVGQPPPGGQYAARPKDNMGLDPYGPSTQQSQQQRLAPMNTLVPISYGLSGAPLSTTHQQQNPHPPSNSYFPGSRGRANTINQLDQVPPTLATARAHLDLEASGIGRNTLTPVINREDAMREWERRQQGGGKLGTAPAYRELEYLQQQVEMDAAAGGPSRWASLGHSGSHRYAPTQPSSLQFQSPAAAVVMDNHDKNNTLRDVAMSSARTAAGLGNSGARYDAPAPPQPAYSGGGTNMLRYATSAGGSGASSANYTSPQQPQQAASPYDSFDHRDGLGTLYMPMQPNQYNTSYTSSQGPSQHAASPMTQQGTQGPQSFYGAGVVAAGGGGPMPNSFASPLSNQSGVSKDARRLSGMDLWSSSR